ncbi:MAG TPA: type II toxin-antitoxin system RelE/ParE family toxin [Candidatus Acidoferrales bacterium]|nr:type II toxin-antitoxin system RelE/ParE family toxin [Candidatus Acidoferrales bacterium]
MAWRIELDPAVGKDLKRIGPENVKRILAFLRERVAPLDDPRSLGEALHGPELGRFWKYRTGNYRIIALIQDHIITIRVIRIGHRRDVYR